MVHWLVVIYNHHKEILVRNVTHTHTGVLLAPGFALRNNTWGVAVLSFFFPQWIEEYTTIVSCYLEAIHQWQLRWKYAINVCVCAPTLGCNSRRWYAHIQKGARSTTNEKEGQRRRREYMYTRKRNHRVSPILWLTKDGRSRRLKLMMEQRRLHCHSIRVQHERSDTI